MEDYNIDEDHSLTDIIKKEIKQRALEAYPVHMSEYSDSCKPYDANESDRLVFIEGYAQCYKDYTYSLQREMELVRDRIFSHTPDYDIRPELPGIMRD